MSAPDSASPVTRRDLKSPYFLLRTPDGIDSYFTSENLPIVQSPKEPLSRFLAPARLVESGTLRSIAYDFDAVPLDAARRMEFLPQSEIDAFAEAVGAFYDKAHAATPRIVPHEKRLRAHFRLPDPDLESDAYWVYGPAHDRRLLILWGCEFRAGTSLPLAPDAELKISAGRTVLDKLQARVMSWETRQREAFKLALDPAEPISRFLARPAVDSDGQPVGVVVGGQTIPEKKLKPLKRLRTAECAAFEKAAARFYDKAKAQTAGVTAYEKELRRAFRLPDPDKQPRAFRMHGKSLIVVVDGKETLDGTLPLVDHPALPPVSGAPAPAAAAAEGAVVVAASSKAKPTVAAKLRLRAVSSKLVYGLAAAAVLVLLIGGLATRQILRDRIPPKVVESADYPATLDANTVVVRFSKALSAASVQAKPAGPGATAPFIFGNNEATVESAALDSHDPSKVVLKTSTLVDGKSYRLTIDGVVDRSGHKLAAATSVEFKYLDTVAPAIDLVSAGENANNLVLIFSKPVAEASAARGSNYTILTLESGGEGAPQKIAAGHLDPEDKNGRTVILEATKDFVGNQPYRLDSIAGVTDTSVSKNPVALPAKGLEFTYRDLLPPRIKGVSASGRKLELTVEFSKPVDPVAAVDVTNYAASAPDKTALHFVSGAAKLDDSGRLLTLRIEPVRLFAGRGRLTATNIADRAGNKPAKPLESAFEFADAIDHSPLTITDHDRRGAQVTLTFNRALDPVELADRSKYRILDSSQGPTDIAVTEARRVPEDPAKVLLILSKAPASGSQLLITATDVTDLFGYKQSGPVQRRMVVSGIGTASEQVLAWLGQPELKGNTVTLTIKEEVARRTAENPANYEFTPDTVRADRVKDCHVETDAKSGTRRTIVTLVLRAPLLSPAGVKLAVHDLEAEGLAFLGPQNLDPIEIVAAR
jgi:hypothetical protein